jgi:galactokinase
VNYDPDSFPAVADLDQLNPSAQTSSSPPRVFRAPGRINLIGEHTDYNSGFVLPVAIQLATRAAVKSKEGRHIAVRSASFDDRVEFDLDNPAPAAHKQAPAASQQAPAASQPWSDYVRGVATAIERAGHRLRGANLSISSDIPIGAGLSSSAALEVAVALALLANSGISLDPDEIARLCQSAENDFVGVRCGIMDQLTSCRARAGHALLLDCRSLEVSHIPIPDSVKLVACNTMVRHELAASEYNLRREQCELGVRMLSAFVPGIQSLRDVTEADLARHGNALDPVTYRRCRHVVTENQRVLNASAALRGSDVTRFGDLMARSHRSLRDDYEVSCAELDLMVALALKLEGVHGARMTGAGFGGCTINLVEAAHADRFAREIVPAYRRETGVACDVYICSPSDGAGPDRPEATHECETEFVK